MIRQVSFCPKIRLSIAAGTKLGRYEQRREESLLSLKVDPKADRLRSDPRFVALLKKIGVEE